MEAKLPKTGETRLISYLPVRDEVDDVVGVSIAVVDISERKRAEGALKESEAHYQRMVDLNPQVLWIMDPQGRNLDVSPRWDKTTGLMKSQYTEHEWLKSVHPSDIQPTVSAIAESRRDGSAIDVHYRGLDGQGGWRWKRSRGTPRFNDSGEIVCWYGSVEDVNAPSEHQMPSFKFESPNKVHTSIHVEGPHLSTMARRIHVLNELEILDTLPEADFDDLAALAAEICGTPISLVTLIDSDRQWFKAAVGLAFSETPLIFSFCAHAIEHDGLFVVQDAGEDQRFRQNPLVTGNPYIRFYAGVPLYAGEGVAIGTLCVIDTVPRTLSPQQTRSLQILSHQVQAQINLRWERRKRAIHTAERSEPVAGSPA